MDPTDRDAQVDLAIRAVRAVRAVKAATADSRPLRTVGWSVLGTAFFAAAVETSNVGQTESAPVETVPVGTTAHEAAAPGAAPPEPPPTEATPLETAAPATASPHTAPPETAAVVAAEAEPENPALATGQSAGGDNAVPLAPDHVSSTHTSGADGSASASTASTFHAHGHAPQGDPSTAPQNDIVVQEVEQAVITPDAQGNLVVETFTHVVVQYHGPTYVSDGHDVATIDPHSGQDVAIHEQAHVTVHENRDGSYSVHTDAHTTVGLVPDTDGKFEASVTQDETATLEQHGHNPNGVGLDVTEVENADNHASGTVQLTQQESANGGAEQSEAASNPGGTTIQGQTAGAGSVQSQAGASPVTTTSQNGPVNGGSHSISEPRTSSPAPEGTQPTTPATAFHGTAAANGTAVGSGTAQGAAAPAEHPLFGAAQIAVGGAAAAIVPASGALGSVRHLPTTDPTAPINTAFTRAQSNGDGSGGAIWRRPDPAGRPLPDGRSYRRLRNTARPGR